MTKNCIRQKDPERIPTTPEEYYSALVKEGPLKRGDHGMLPGSFEPSKCHWYREELIEEGQNFVKNNFYSVMLAHCIALLWTFTLKPGRALLLATANSSIEFSRNRYLSTILHIKLWYETDFTSKDSRGAQSIYRASKYHMAAANRCHKGEPTPTPELSPNLKKLLQAVQEEVSSIKVIDSALQQNLNEAFLQAPISQCSMVIVQFCLVGLLVLMPKYFGIYDTEGIDGFVHNWAIFGRLLGIQDRYNLCVHYLSMKRERRMEVFQLIFREMFLTNLKNIDGTVIYAWDGMLKGFQHYLIGLRPNAMIYFMIKCAVDASQLQELRKLMSWKDKWSFQFMEFSTHWFAHAKFWRLFRNNCVRFSFYIAVRKYLPKWNSRVSSRKKYIWNKKKK